MRARVITASKTPLRLAFLGFIVALLGATAGLVVDYRRDGPIGYLVGGIIFIGWLVAGTGIVWGWRRFFRWPAKTRAKPSDNA